MNVSIFGKYISQYVSLYLEKGQSKKSVLSVGFDLNLWNATLARRKKRKNNKRRRETEETQREPGRVTEEGGKQVEGEEEDDKEARPMTEEEKDALIDRIVERIKAQIESTYGGAPVRDLFHNNRLHFFELKTHLEGLCHIYPLADTGPTRTKLRELKRVLKEEGCLLEISQLSRHCQEQLMRWVTQPITIDNQ